MDNSSTQMVVMIGRHIEWLCGDIYDDDNEMKQFRTLLALGQVRLDKDT